MLGIFLDIESTGLDPKKHQAIDIALKVINLSIGGVVGTFQSLIQPSQASWELRDLNSMEVNGYTWEMVSIGLEIEVIRQEILDLFKGLKIGRGKAVFICQNPAFDRGFFAQIVDIYTQEQLQWPYHWLDLASMYWALLAKKCGEEKKSFPDMLNLSKNEIARLYGLPPEAAPHRAMNGVEHLILCYEKVLGISIQ